jgi:hypothetical protein
MFRNLSALITGCLLAAAAPMPGGVVLITQDKALWTSTVGAYLTEDFNDHVFQPGISYTGDMGSLDIPAFRDQVARSEGFGNLNFATPVLAAGADWDLSPNGPGSGVAVRVYYQDGSWEDLSQEIPNSFNGQFFGLVTDKPFNRVRYTGGTQPTPGPTDINQETLSLDNLVYSGAVTGGGSAVPEPATWTLIGAGALAVLTCRRRSKGDRQGSSV